MNLDERGEISVSEVLLAVIMVFVILIYFRIA